jgi:hypothetical protein
MIGASVREGKREELKLRPTQILKKFCPASQRSRFRGRRPITAQSIGSKRIDYPLSEGNKVDILIERAIGQKPGRTANRMSKTESVICSFLQQHRHTQTLGRAVGRPAKQIQASVAQITGATYEYRKSAFAQCPLRRVRVWKVQAEEIMKTIAAIGT